jgi:hypothetical protein
MQQATHLQQAIDAPRPSPGVADAHTGAPGSDHANRPPRRMHDAWRVLWATPAFVMVALRITAPDAWAALLLLVASVAVLNADALVRSASRLSKHSPVRRDDSGGRADIA